MAHRAKAIESKDLERVAVDTTVQEKAIAHPTDARLIHRAIEKLVDLAKREGVKLRQSYLRLDLIAQVQLSHLMPAILQLRPLKSGVGAVGSIYRGLSP